MAEERTTLADLTAALAADAVTTQRKLDEAHARAEARFAQMIQEIPGELAAIAVPLSPRRLVVRSFRMSCSASLTRAASVHFSLSARPIGAGYERVYHSARSHSARVCVEVEQVPLDPAARPLVEP